jgi:hypothetical protein
MLLSFGFIIISVIRSLRQIRWQTDIKWKISDLLKFTWKKTEFLNYNWTANPEIEETRDVHVEDGENSFKMFIGFNFKRLL